MWTPTWHGWTYHHYFPRQIYILPGSRYTRGVQFYNQSINQLLGADIPGVWSSTINQSINSWEQIYQGIDCSFSINQLINQSINQTSFKSWDWAGIPGVFSSTINQFLGAGIPGVCSSTINQLIPGSRYTSGVQFYNQSIPESKNTRGVQFYNQSIKSTINHQFNYQFI